MELGKLRGSQNKPKVLFNMILVMTFIKLYVNNIAFNAAP